MQLEKHPPRAGVLRFCRLTVDYFYMNLKFIRNIAWLEVLDDWREREKDHWGWEEHIKERGFKDWDEFRSRIHSKFSDPSVREWKLYQVEDPYKFVPNIFIGAFPGWKKYYPEGVNKIRFIDLVRNPEVAKNPKVASIVKSFLSPTTIIGLRYKDDFMLYEGTHRACALSLLRDRKNRPEIDLKIVLTELDDNEEMLFKKSITQIDEKVGYESL